MLTALVVFFFALFVTFVFLVAFGWFGLVYLQTKALGHLTLTTGSFLCFAASGIVSVAIYHA